MTGGALETVIFTCFFMHVLQFNYKKYQHYISLQKCSAEVSEGLKHFTEKQNKYK